MPSYVNDQLKCHIHYSFVLFVKLTNWDGHVWSISIFIMGLGI